MCIDTLTLLVTIIIGFFSFSIVVLIGWQVCHLYQNAKFKDNITAEIDKINKRNSFIDDFNICINESFTLEQHRREELVNKMLVYIATHDASINSSLYDKIAIFIMYLNKIVINSKYENEWAILKHPVTREMMGRISDAYTDFEILTACRIFIKLHDGKFERIYENGKEYIDLLK